MTYYGYEIYDETATWGNWEVAMHGWVYTFKTLDEAKKFIKENRNGG